MKKNQPSVTFRKEALDGGWTFFDVISAGSVVGRITLHQKTRRYRYFPGVGNTISFEFEDKDLVTMKRRVIEYLENCTPTRR